MKGLVVSIMPSYGFIRDNAGTSYFFTPQRMASGQDYGEIKIDMALEFTQKAGPRGMIAENIRIVEMHSGVQVPRKLIIASGDEMLPNDLIIDECNFQVMQSCWFKSPSDAMDQLKSAASQSSANVIAGVKIHKRIFSEGNYKYTMHSFSGKVGTYSKHKLLEDKKMAATSRLEAFSFQGEVLNAMKVIAEDLDKKRAKQESYGYIQIGVCAIITFAIISCASILLGL